MKPDSTPEELQFRQDVERIIEKRVRPELMLHDGNIEIRDTRAGEVWVVLTGACRSCPSAQITLEEIVTETLKDELGDRLAGVHLVNETDEDLLNFARQLLNKNK